MRPITGEREEIHQHSGWWLPFGFAVVILVLCAAILGWYLRPSAQGSAPSGGSQIIHVSVHGVRLGVPVNYIANSRDRAGGPLDSLSLAALFPSFRGYSREDARLFMGNPPDSPVIRLTLRGDANGLRAQERLNRIYKPYITNAKGGAGPFGLTRYSFAKGSGYEGSELFAGTDARGLALFLCEIPTPDIPSPNCLAPDRPLGSGKDAHSASLSWRFKRAYLARWHEVNDGVYALIARFEKSG